MKQELRFAVVAAVLLLGAGCAGMAPRTPEVPTPAAGVQSTTQGSADAEDMSATQELQQAEQQDKVDEQSDQTADQAAIKAEEKDAIETKESAGVSF